MFKVKIYTKLHGLGGENGCFYHCCAGKISFTLSFSVGIFSGTMFVVPVFYLSLNLHQLLILL